MPKFNVRSNIVNKSSLRVVQKSTLKVLADTLTKSFGPNGVNTAYRKEKDIARRIWHSDDYKIGRRCRYYV